MAKSIRKRINPFKFENLLKLLFIAVATVMILSACSVRQAQKTLLNSEGVKGAHVGIAIYNDSKEQWLSKYQSDHYFTPASNVKILATYLGLQFLGDSLPGWKMAENADTLFLMPLGDPSFMHPEFKYQPVVDIIKNTNKQVVIVGNNQDQFEIFGSGWSWADYAEDYQPERSRMPIYGNVVHFYQSNKKLEAIKPFYFFKDIVDLGKAEEKNWSRSRTGNRFFTTNENNKSKYFQVPFSQEDMPMVKALELLNDTLGKKISFQKQSTLPATSYKTIKTVPTDSLLKIMMLRSDNFYADQIVLMASEQLFGKMDDAALLDSTKKLFFADLPQKMRWADGSGLSRYNLNTPENYIAILQQMHSKFGEARVKNIFEKGGEGTISAYYKNFPGTMYAKTGTLGGQVALSGFIYTPKQQKLYFSVLVANHMSPSSTQVRRAVETYLTKVTKGM
ncbi:MAG: D-alanyl-D-alanine carboxypeptidase/D-alanyl-D-alanine-endopeptidase [Bacteroidota bacterium]|jgi:D-alanyl-D-alanine carboxypeptidase/D-alanyl-D-alanine-endopeptidase (penicillin-binding protein 4)